MRTSPSPVLCPTRSRIAIGRTERSRTWRCAAGVLFAGVLFGPLAYSQDTNPGSVQWHDLRFLDLLADDPNGGVHFDLPLRTTTLDSMKPAGSDVPLEDPVSLSPTDVGDLVTDALGIDWPDNSMLVDIRGSLLRVEGNAETHKRTREILDDVMQGTLATVDIDLFVLPSGSLPPNGRPALSPAQTDAWLASVDPDLHVQRRIRCGTRSHLCQPSLTATVYDYRADVAQRVYAADPDVTVLMEGLDVGVIVQPYTDGRLYVRLWGRQGMAPNREHKIDIPALGGGTVELASQRSTLLACSAMLENGGSILVGQDLQSNAPWLVRVRRSSPAPDIARVLSLGPLTSRSMRVRVPVLDLAQPSGGWSRDYWGSRYRELTKPTQFQAEDLLSLVLDERERTGPLGAVLTMGPNLYIPDSPELTAFTQRQLAELSRGSSGRHSRTGGSVGFGPRRSFSQGLARIGQR